MTINDIKWPELIRIDTVELPVIALLSGVGGAVVWCFSKPLALVIFTPGLLCLIAVAVTVDMDTSAVQTGRKKALCHSFHVHSVIATDAREYRGETKESYDRPVQSGPRNL
ncbi:MAG: hypothetical protein JSW47_03825 [Phycisphaerales bacterium]|nr:MAG: hypothetical protein JSW47_03825 [Phycisphaerales bacterium]